MKVSDCCGAAPISNGDMDFEDIGICSACRDHCEYIEEGEIEMPTRRGRDEDLKQISISDEIAALNNNPFIRR